MTHTGAYTASFEKGVWVIDDGVLLGAWDEEAEKAQLAMITWALRHKADCPVECAKCKHSCLRNQTTKEGVTGKATARSRLGQSDMISIPYRDGYYEKCLDSFVCIDRKGPYADGDYHEIRWDGGCTYVLCTSFPAPSMNIPDRLRAQEVHSCENKWDCLRQMAARVECWHRTGI